MRVAVIGVTGAVGREMLSELEASSLPVELVPLASPRSEGQSIAFRGKHTTVKAFNLDLIKDCKYVLMSAGGAFSKEYAKSIAECGPIVIDNSSAWRMDPSVPLVVPEVNPEALKGHKNIIANPKMGFVQCTSLNLPVSIW